RTVLVCCFTPTALAEHSPRGQGGQWLLELPSDRVPGAAPSSGSPSDFVNHKRSLSIHSRFRGRRSQPRRAPERAQSERSIASTVRLASADGSTPASAQTERNHAVRSARGIAGQACTSQ